MGVFIFYKRNGKLYSTYNDVKDGIDYIVRDCVDRGIKRVVAVMPSVTDIDTTVDSSVIYGFIESAIDLASEVNKKIASILMNDVSKYIAVRLFDHEGIDKYIYEFIESAKEHEVNEIYIPISDFKRFYYGGSVDDKVFEFFVSSVISYIGYIFEIRKTDNGIAVVIIPDEEDKEEE